METNWKDLIGKRILFQSRYQYFSVSEAKVLEVSPSGEYVKLEIVRSNGTKYAEWEDAVNTRLIEVLEGGEQDGE